MSKTRKVFKWLLAIVVIIGLLITLAFYATSGLSNVANQQLSALRHGDFDKAYSYTSKSFQDNTSLAQFTAFVKKYPGLENNLSASFNSREIKNNIGTLGGKLTSRDGAVLPIHYQLVKENDQWKILSIKLGKVGIVDANDRAKVKQNSDENEKTKVNQNSNAESSELSHTYTSTQFGYRIKYPDGWVAKDPKPNTLIIYNRGNVAGAFVTLNIQTLLSKDKGGRYPNIDAALSDLQSQLKTAGQFKILKKGNATFTGPNSNKLEAKYFVVSYHHKGHDIMQAQYALRGKTGLLFFLIGLTGTPNDFQKYKPVMDKMLHSWQQFKVFKLP